MTRPLPYRDLPDGSRLTIERGVGRTWWLDRAHDGRCIQAWRFAARSEAIAALLGWPHVDKSTVQEMR